MLKLHNLLFLTVVSSTYNDTYNEDNNLINIFSFKAKTYGIIDEDIENEFFCNKEQRYYINKDNTTINTNIKKTPNILNEHQKNIIEKSVDILLDLNNEILNMNQFIICDIIHVYNSWKLNYNTKTQIIDKDCILGDKRYFKL